MNKPNANCGRKDCSFAVDCAYSTMVHYIGPDQNTTSGRMSCLACNRKWFFVNNYEGTQFTELKLGAANENELE